MEFYRKAMELLSRGHYLLFPPELKLKPLERKLIDEVLSALPRALADHLEFQIQSYNLVQRDGHLQKAHFYRLEKGMESYPDGFRFPRQTGDEKFAAVRFVVQGQERPFTATFRTYNGRFFVMAFDRSVRDVLEREDVTVQKATVWSEALMGNVIT